MVFVIDFSSTILQSYGQLIWFIKDNCHVIGLQWQQENLYTITGPLQPAAELWIIDGKLYTQVRNEYTAYVLIGILHFPRLI
jgi:hypothetical protein